MEGFMIHPRPFKNGVLEIKCPYSIDGTLITKEQIANIVKKYGRKFFLEQNGKHMTLKRNLNYSQVHKEMAILKVSWCDFVVWTIVDIHTECICFNSHFWENELLPKCDHFKLQP